MLAESKSLLEQRDAAHEKERILLAFRKHYTLNDQEITCLNSAAVPVDDLFFATLVKAKVIHKDSRLLMSLGNENHRLGLEIVEQTSRYINVAFNKLSRWLTYQFKGLDLENPRINFPIRRGLRVLAERPSLFQSCLDTFAEARERTLESSFYVALTGEGSESKETVKPIEFSAYEPLRYIGDMLAWAHSAAVSEKEALEVLFVSEGDEIARGIQEGLESDPWALNDSVCTFDGPRALVQLVRRSLSRVSYLIRQRAGQIIQAHEEPNLLYRTSNLFVFYQHIFNKLLSVSNDDEDAGVFMKMLESLKQSAHAQFRVAMKFFISNLVNDNMEMPSDLSIPEYMHEGHNQMKLLLKTYDASAATTDASGTGLRLLLAESLDPLLESCSMLARDLSQLDFSIFMINCFLASRSILLDHSTTRANVASLDERISEHATNIVYDQHRYFLKSSGLERLINVIENERNRSNDQVQVTNITTQAAFSPEVLSNIAEQLDEFLPSALIDGRENLRCLQSSSLSHKIVNEVAEKFCDDFDLVESILLEADTENARTPKGETQRPHLRDSLHRSGEEVRILLS